MTEIYNLNQIKNALKDIDPLPEIEDGFKAYSRGEAVIPPVGEMLFEDPPGEMHIKYGYIKNQDFAVIKIAGGFYENVKMGLPSTDGLMLMFSQKTGQLEAVLLDEGYLTNVRTAAAGAAAAKYLAPKNIKAVGVFGAGVQGRMQAEFLKPLTSCRDIWAWGLNEEETALYKKDMEASGFNVRTTLDPEEAAAHANLFITATPSKKPLIKAGWIKPGTHITAMGSDTPEKQELDPDILAAADIVVADSIAQSSLRGEIFHAVKAGAVSKDKIQELGQVISEPSLQRQTEDQITVADLTGVAVQDIKIAAAVYRKLRAS
jgi:ornithine cyclodeaminase